MGHIFSDVVDAAADRAGATATGQRLGNPVAGMRMNAAKRTSICALVLAGSAFVMSAASADNGGDYRRGEGRGEGRGEFAERFGPLSPEQREARRERREAMRERWQQLPPEDRQRWIEQRRHARQLSPEERQQLRRDILEANRGSRDDRGR